MGAAFLFAVLLLQVQDLPHNPRGVTFLCPDHARDDAHELDVIDHTTQKVVMTLQLGDPPIDITGMVVADINIQPMNVGVYEFRVRAKIGNSVSDSSNAWVWERIPGRPTIK